MMKQGYFFFGNESEITCPLNRAGNHVTFVYGNIVSQLMVFAILLIDLFFKLLLIFYIDHVLDF